MSSGAAGPVFVVLEPAGASALEPPRRIAWACEEDAGTADAPQIADAVRRIAGLAGERGLGLADPLFDAPRLDALFAGAGLAAPEMRDWLLALAPFGQARNLAALLESAAARADPDNPATRLLEAWREASRRAARAKRS